MCDDDLAMRCSNHAPVAEHGRFAAGTVFGDWRTTAFIGRGGNGEVYCAEHVALGTPAAVKVLTREEERAKERFAREAKLLAEMKSKAFPRFFAYGEANGVPYLAMELLEPGDLPTGDRAVAKFMLKVCDAVGELHALGYVHRDMKP
jgi:serine/threonine-protein kinase